MNLQRSGSRGQNGPPYQASNTSRGVSAPAQAPQPGMPASPPYLWWGDISQASRTRDGPGNTAILTPCSTGSSTSGSRRNLNLDALRQSAREGGQSEVTVSPCISTSTASTTLDVSKIDGRHDDRHCYSAPKATARHQCR